MSNILLILLYLFPLPLFFVLLSLFRNVRSASHSTAWLSALGWFIVGISIKKDGGLWLGFFAGLVWFLVFFCIYKFAGLFEKKYTSPRPFPSGKKEILERLKDDYIADAEKRTGRKLDTPIRKIDQAIDDLETIHDITDEIAGDGDVSPGGMIQLLLIVLWFCVLYFVAGKSLGHGEGITAILELIVCGALALALGPYTWNILPASLRLTGRVAMFLWPLTLLSLYLLFSK